MRRIDKLTLFFVFFLFFLSVTFKAESHHITGLPHYSYQDRYQPLRIEEVKTHGDYEINFSYFRIYNTNTVELSTYIKNLRTGKPYAGKVILKVFGEGEAPESTDPYEAKIVVANTYKAGWTYEDDGIYYTRISFAGDEGKEITSDFRMQVGEVRTQWKWIAAAGGCFLILFAVVVYKKRNSAK